MATTCAPPVNDLHTAGFHIIELKCWKAITPPSNAVAYHVAGRVEQLPDHCAALLQHAQVTPRAWRPCGPLHHVQVLSGQLYGSIDATTTLSSHGGNYVESLNNAEEEERTPF